MQWWWSANVVDGGDVISCTIDSSGRHGLPTSTEKLSLPEHGLSVIAEGSKSSAVKTFLLVSQIPESWNPDWILLGVAARVTLQELFVECYKKGIVSSELLCIQTS